MCPGYTTLAFPFIGFFTKSGDSVFYNLAPTPAEIGNKSFATLNVVKQYLEGLAKVERIFSTKSDK